MPVKKVGLEVAMNVGTVFVNFTLSGSEFQRESAAQKKI